MPKLDPPTLFALPQTPDGKAVANLLLTSYIVATLHFCLAIGTFGAWELCILWVMGPLTLLHHAVLTIFLHKAKLKTYETGLVPQCFTSTFNSVCSLVVFLVWFVGAVVGIMIPAIFDQPTAVVWGLVTFVLGGVEFLTMMAMLSQMKRLRDEKERKDIESSVLVHFE